MQKIRKYKIEGTAELIGLDGQRHRKIMIRIRSRGRRCERWIDVSNNSSCQIGDSIQVVKNPLYTIVSIPEGGDNDVRSGDENQ